MKQLVMEAQNGNADSFVKLVEANRQQMYKIAFCYLKQPEDIADVIQDTILTAFERLGDLKQPRYFKTWLVRILINKCKNALNRYYRETTVERIPDTGIQDDTLSRIIFREMLSEVDKKYQDALILYYVEGFHAKEIANILGLKENTVFTRIRRGREQLKHIYESYQTERVVNGYGE